MALIKCPACGNPVSTKAARCPHCGTPPPSTGSPVADPAPVSAQPDANAAGNASGATPAERIARKAIESATSLSASGNEGKTRRWAFARLRSACSALGVAMDSPRTFQRALESRDSDHINAAVWEATKCDPLEVVQAHRKTLEAANLLTPTARRRLAFYLGARGQSEAIQSWIDEDEAAAASYVMGAVTGGQAQKDRKVNTTVHHSAARGKIAPLAGYMHALARLGQGAAAQEGYVLAMVLQSMEVIPIQFGDRGHDLVTSGLLACFVAFLKDNKGTKVDPVDVLQGAWQTAHQVRGKACVDTTFTNLALCDARTSVDHPEMFALPLSRACSRVGRFGWIFELVAAFRPGLRSTPNPRIPEIFGALAERGRWEQVDMMFKKFGRDVRNVTAVAIAKARENDIPGATRMLEEISPRGTNPRGTVGVVMEMAKACARRGAPEQAESLIETLLPAKDRWEAFLGVLAVLSEDDFRLHKYVFHPLSLSSEDGLWTLTECLDEDFALQFTE